MNQVGYPLEMYDHYGRFRSLEQAQAPAAGLPTPKRFALVIQSISKVTFLGCLLLSSVCAADDFSSVGPLLAKYCLRCHGAEEQSARIRFDQISGYAPADQHLWTMVHEALRSGQMPPQEETQLSNAERRQILDWILAQAAAARSLDPQQRRLNRREFSAALQDLTGLPIDFGAGLPDDGRIDGFDTGAEGLQDGADSVAQFLEVSRRAVDSIRFREPERQSQLRIDFREHDFPDFFKFVEQTWKEQGIFTRSKGLTCRPGIGLYLPTQWTGDRGNSFLAVPAPADKRAAFKMTLRVSARRPLPGLPLPTLWVKVGGAYLDYRPISEEPQTLTYAVRMEDHLVEGDVIKIMLQSFVEVPYAVEGFENDDRSKPEDNIPGGVGVFRPAFDRKQLRTPEQQPVPAIVIESITIDYDHIAAWPPASWQAKIGQIEDNEASAEKLLTLWMERAWRRPTTKAEVARFFTLYQTLRGQSFSFDDALRAAFQSVLMGGPFRYLASPSDPNPVVAQYAIASRISFLLTGAPPDEELRRLAASGQLREPAVLDAQVDRLLNDARSDAFFRPFVTQWLQLDQPITLTMSHFKKQDFKFGRRLKESMKEETIQYVARLFHDNRPAGELVASDWTMMNDILAVHYGYDPLTGGELRKVAIKPRADDPRGGGVLGHAGIQSMLCWMGDNWVIYRGSWTLTHILDDPPPPPPLEVPELLPSDQSNRGKSFRELLAQHQADSKCSVCHQKMDPLGFAFQNFDLSGRWRNVEYDHYHRAELDGKIEWRGEGKTRPVDAAGKLPRGETFASFLECKQQLAAHYQEDIVLGLLKKLTLYGTGRKANILDLATLRDIMQAEAGNDYPLRDLLKALIRSRVFLETATTTTAGVSP
ncbi:DUF1592 domain-containing protein [Lignipirellula cremea]|uniref:Planctomycete cytochrome C n=1 Tax=Lignipirellula cremea TaxID=2528010 RepID=A0A518DKW6_9BACT|nr:DUF1592 domain-containing protein [Lignipirellula cremea]QDU92483.1 hypothetical protein Pla8534_02310 [Lignipirellula cremea]